MICEQMGWTHETFLEQPEWFIKTLRIKNSTFARVENERNKKIQNGMTGV